MQSDTNISRHTERKRKYPVTNSKELLCKKDNYIEITNQLDCFGSKEPHNDDNSSYLRHSECNEESHNREDFTNNAILRGLNNYSPQNDCKVAFTLAEVLITLGIIGVVAVLTLPTLVANYKEKVLVIQVKKSYSEMQNAVNSYVAQNGCSSISCISDTNQTTDELANKFFSQFKNAQKCVTKNSQNPRCKHVSIKANTPYYTNGVGAIVDGFSPVFVSANGVAYAFEQFSVCPREIVNIVRDKDGFPVLDENDKPKTYKTTSKNCALIYFDANGVDKGPNQFGADVYRFDITSDGKFVDNGSSPIKYVLTNEKLNYTPYEIGKPKN